MGNTSNSQNKTKFEDYQFIQKLAEGKSLMQHTEKKQLTVIIEHTFPNEEMLNEYVKKNRANLGLTHQFYINAFDYQILSLANICSKQFKMVEYFQYQPHTIQQEIQNRQNNQRPFNVKEIMSILCSCVLAMSYISKLELTHYTLNPTDIIIDQDGVCKILSSALSEYLFDFNPNHNFYYSPETLKIFKMQSVTNALTNKSAVFTLGLTILSMINLCSMNYLYNFSSFTVNLQEINTLIAKVQDSNLRSVLKKMLKYHSYERITFTELEEMLFEIINKTEKGQKDSVQLENQHYQISKLEQSIMRIQHDSEDADSSKDISFSQSVKRSHHQLFSESVAPLENDQEDLPQIEQPTRKVTFQDPIVMDEYQKPSGSQSENYSNRQSQISSNFPCQLTHYSQFRKKPLMENSNISNIAETQNLLNRANNEPYSKNSIDYFCKKGLENKQLEDLQRRYVSEEFKEGRYEGYKNGKYRHGFGTFYYKDGGKYCGQWNKNKMEGKGVLYYQNSKIAYEGQWLQDHLNGYGVLYNQRIAVLQKQFDFHHLQLLDDKWIKYQGYFKDDLKNGQGTVYLSNGESFRGCFQKDQPNGWGQFRNVRGEVIKGFWLMGALNTTS